MTSTYQQAAPSPRAIAYPQSLCLLATMLAGSSLQVGCVGGGDDLGVSQAEDGQPEAVATDGSSSPSAAQSSSSTGAGAQSPSAAPDTPQQPKAEEQDELLLAPGSSDGGVNCHRVVTLNNVVLQTPPPFDVVIVADHSESLSWSREELGSGLSELARNVHGHSVRFFVLTPTQYDATSAAAIDFKTGADLVSWQDPTSGQAYADAVTRYVQSCTDLEGRDLICPGYPPPAIEFQLAGHWEFVMPEPVAQLDSEMTIDQLEAEREKVVSAILALGTSGSPQEQPLCTLSRYLEQKPQALPERAAFLIISDEDDTASVDNCFAEYSFSQSSSDQGLVGGCTSNCDSYTFTATGPASSNTLEFSCAPVDDLGNVGSRDTWQSDSLRKGITETCGGQTSVECTDEERASAQSECNAGLELQSCVRVCVENDAEFVCGLSATDEGVDLCTQPFEQGGVEYQDIYDYCAQTRDRTGWDSCYSVGYALSGTAKLTSQGRLSPLLNVATPGDFIHLFHANADRLFGPDNYFVETIVFTEGAACTPEPGQSYATELEPIATSPEHVFPICESYEPALNVVDEFAQELLQTEYALELGVRERIDGITVTSRDGTSRALTADDYQYDSASSKLTIARSALRSSDLALDVEVVDPCAPKVR